MLPNMPTPRYPSYLAIDLETTGLNPDTDRILEVAAIWLDEDFLPIERHEWRVFYTHEQLASMALVMDEEVVKMHDRSGLWHDLHQGGSAPLKTVETLIASTHRALTQGVPLPLVGSSPHGVDRPFIRRQMPAVDECLTHRHVDSRVLSSIAGSELVGPLTTDEPNHRAMTDLFRTIEILHLSRILLRTAIAIRVHRPDVWEEYERAEAEDDYRVDVAMDSPEHLGGKWVQRSIDETPLMNHASLSSEPVTTEVTHDLLGLVMDIPPSIDDVAQWSDEQREQAADWAGAAHSNASDNDVEVPPSPPHVYQHLRVDPGELLTTDGLRDLLGHVFRYGVSPEIIEKWTEEERHLAAEWASAMHLASSGYDIEIPTEPQNIREIRGGCGRW